MSDKESICSICLASAPEFNGCKAAALKAKVDKQGGLKESKGRNDLLGIVNATVLIVLVERAPVACLLAINVNNQNYK